MLKNNRSFILIIGLFTSLGCGAQNGLENKKYIIAKKSGRLQDYCNENNVDILRLRAFNPAYKNDSVKAKDTIFLVQTKAASTIAKKDEYLEKPTGKSGRFKEVSLNGKKYLVMEVNPHDYKIELFNRLQKPGVYNFSMLANEKKQDLVFIMNGGMFEKDLKPVGLFVSEGTQYNNINLRKGGSGNFYDLPPNGVFYLDNNERPAIIQSDLYAAVKSIPRIATQSGPMLVINDTYNPKFTEGSDNLNIRNGVGISNRNTVVFVVSKDPVNFYEFAKLFKEKLACSNALYLDGLVSQYYAPELNTPASQHYELGVFITVSQRGKIEGEKNKETIKPATKEKPKEKGPEKNARTKSATK